VPPKRQPIELHGITIQKAAVLPVTALHISAILSLVLDGSVYFVSSCMRTYTKGGTEVLTAMYMNGTAIWDVTPCGPVGIH
jgi:uncharacterized protein (UPF0276 family)